MAQGPSYQAVNQALVPPLWSQDGKLFQNDVGRLLGCSRSEGVLVNHLADDSSREACFSCFSGTSTVCLESRLVDEGWEKIAKCFGYKW